MTRIKLITSQSEDHHVALDTVREFERTILTDKSVSEPSLFNKFNAKSSFYFWKIETLFGFSFDLSASFFKFLFDGKKHFFAVLMGPNFRKCFPYYSFPNEKSLYLFDSWPKRHKEIAAYANAFSIDHLFISSSQAAAKLQSLVKSSSCHWVPEGIDPGLYHFNPVEKKDIDVLALGRKYKVYHNLIVSGLQASGKNYRFEKVKGELVFQTRNEFIEGLARTKISICIPSHITHPLRAGNIQTMTVRYLQSMASKCLIVGHAPEEMIHLFGYNPVIEINMEDPVNQLLTILDHFSEYEDLIERNYTEVLANHTWEKRWKQIAEIIAV